MASKRITRKKSRNSGFLHVRSMPHIKMLEKMMKKKDTLVYVYAPWCGACREFDANVMNHVQNLKNKTINVAKVDSKLISKTGLPAPQFLPTLMYVKDGSPKTFTDENGQPTNVMPRSGSSEQDRETLQNLVQDPRNTITNRNSKTLKNNVGTLSSTPGKLTLPSYNKNGSADRSNTTLNSLARSPYDSIINGMPTPPLEEKSKQAQATQAQDTLFSPIKNTIKASIPVSSPPDIGADLVASQGKTLSNTPPKLGGMLSAIRQKTNSLNALTRLRKTRRN